MTQVKPALMNDIRLLTMFRGKTHWISCNLKRKANSVKPVSLYVFRQLGMLYWKSLSNFNVDSSHGQVNCDLLVGLSDFQGNLRFGSKLAEKLEDLRKKADFMRVLIHNYPSVAQWKMRAVNYLCQMMAFLIFHLFAIYRQNSSRRWSPDFDWFTLSISTYH